MMVKWVFILFLSFMYFNAFAQADHAPDRIQLKNGSVLNGKAYYQSMDDSWTILLARGDSIKVKADELLTIVQGKIIPGKNKRELKNRDELKFRHNISAEYISAGAHNDAGTGSFAMQLIYQPVFRFLPRISAGPFLGIQGGYPEDDLGSDLPQLLFGGGGEIDLAGGKWIPYFSVACGYNYFKAVNSNNYGFTLSGGLFSNANAGLQLKIKNGVRLRLSGGISYQYLKEKSDAGWVDYKTVRDHHLFRYIVKMGVQI